MTTFVPLSGSETSLLKKSMPAGPVDRSELASITVRVQPKGNPQAVLDKAYEIATAPLDKRQYLTHAELAALGGADPQHLDLIESYAQRHNLVVAHRSAAQRHVVLRGSLGNLLSAFPTDVQLFNHPTGQYRAAIGPVSVPQLLSPLVTGVVGFDTRPKRRGPGLFATPRNDGPGGKDGRDPTWFANRYNFPTQFGGAKLDGAGQTVAIIELGGGYTASDLQAYFQKHNLPVPSVTSASVEYASSNPTTPDSDDGEVMLDIEIVGAVVPAATIVVYFAPNTGDQGLLQAISAAVNDTERKPSVISISWGSPESHVSPNAVQAYHEVFASAAALGITICASTGDHGTADMGASEWDQQIHVDHPASDDLVLACGGTQINLAKNQETAWNDGTPFNINAANGGGWATGGGISTLFAVPAYQKAIQLPDSLAGGDKMRGIPDIAMSATNYAVRIDTLETCSGGTSAVAPLMAGLVARLNQAKRKNQGALHTFLYANASKGIFKPITAGNNQIASTVVGYPAGAGWNACTGLGTPDGTAILNLL